MHLHWLHVGPSVLAAFFASLVEFVEALTVVLAVGTIRGWQSALSGSIAAVVLLIALTAAFGKALTQMPLNLMQFAIGILLLLFGLRWLRKAILRAAGIVALHNEAAIYAEQTEHLRERGGSAGTWDHLGFTTAFKITMIEGAEVVFIVIAIGAGGTGLLLPASLGAFAALLCVIVLGFALRRPLANVPENLLKFIVGVLLSAFGTFWFGEGIGILWPGGDWAIIALLAGYTTITVLATGACKLGVDRTTRIVGR